jgi:uncharacterized paraquat-inducible protein A
MFAAASFDPRLIWDRIAETQASMGAGGEHGG